jgi:hypothetical protein
MLQPAPRPPLGHTSPAPRAHADTRLSPFFALQVWEHTHMDGRLNKCLDKLVTIVINEHVTHAVCTLPADAHARVTRGAMVGAVTVLPLRALPHYRTKLCMARAVRTMAPLVLSSAPPCRRERGQAPRGGCAAGGIGRRHRASCATAASPRSSNARFSSRASRMGSMNQSSFVGYAPTSRRPRNAHCRCVAFAWAVTSI